MIPVLAADHVRQHPRPRSSLLDGTRRQDGLHHALLAAPAGVLRSHILPDYERRRYVVQLLGDVRTDAYLRAVAGRAVPLTGRRYYLDALAWQIGWQSTPARVAPTQ